jgi:hypothetical protein
MRREGYVASMEDMRNAHKILFEKSEGVGVEGRKSILRSGI